MKSLQSQEDTTPQSESRFPEITHPYQAAAVSEEHQITSFPSSSRTPQATSLALHILEISLLYVRVSSELNRGTHDESGGLIATTVVESSQETFIMSSPIKLPLLLWSQHTRYNFLLECQFLLCKGLFS